MTGRKIVLPEPFSDTTLPKLRIDPVLPDSGALMLIDPTHPASPWAAGNPLHGAVLPNIAGAQAAALLGTTVELASPGIKVPAAFTGAVGKLERTPKGGLHGIAAQTGTVPAHSGPLIHLPTSIIAWILQYSQTHAYFFSTWHRTTRLATCTNATIAGINCNAQQTNNYLTYTADRADMVRAYPTPQVHGASFSAGAVTPPSVGLGNHYFNNGAKKWISTSIPGDGSNTPVTGLYASGYFGFGASAQAPGIGAQGQTGLATCTNSSVSSPTKEQNGSHVFYRLYLEDLTASGRSYATVDALDRAEYTKQVLTAGGRYYGDTIPTDPATIP